jgi:putative addiction module component (TIGR02574 family)
MASSAKSVLEDALKLPAGERAEIASRLLVSLDPNHDDPAEVEKEWAIEIERRCQALHNGTTTIRSWQELRESLWANFQPQ